MLYGFLLHHVDNVNETLDFILLDEDCYDALDLFISTIDTSSLLHDGQPETTSAASCSNGSCYSDYDPERACK